MALTAQKTWVAGEVLLASDLNSEFAHIYTGGDLSWPAQTEKDLNGQEFWLDGNKDTSFKTKSDDVLTLKMKGADNLFAWDGDSSAPVNGFRWTAADAGSEPSMAAVGDDTDIDIELTPKGTGNVTQGGTRVLLLGDEETAQTILAGQVFG
jgi:hypothetical protein